MNLFTWEYVRMSLGGRLSQHPPVIILTAHRSHRELPLSPISSAVRLKKMELERRWIVSLFAGECRDGKAREGSRLAPDSGSWAFWIRGARKHHFRPVGASHDI